MGSIPTFRVSIEGLSCYSQYFSTRTLLWRSRVNSALLLKPESLYFHTKLLSLACHQLKQGQQGLLQLLIPLFTCGYLKMLKVINNAK